MKPVRSAIRPDRAAPRGATARRGRTPSIASIASMTPSGAPAETEPLAELVDALVVMRRDVELVLVRDAREQRPGARCQRGLHPAADLAPAARREVEAIAEVLVRACRRARR